MKKIVGVMGPGDDATEQDKTTAYELGQLIAAQGWVLLTGGRNVGVMDSASRGAKDAKGLVVGVLPDSDLEEASKSIDIAIFTEMGQARNNINILSCSAVVVCGMNPGTASEAALAIRAEKPLVLLNIDKDCEAFFLKLSSQQAAMAENAQDAVEKIALMLSRTAVCQTELSQKR